MVKTLVTAVAERIKIANNSTEDSVSTPSERKGLKFWLLVTVPAVAVSGIAGGTYLVIRRRSHR